MKTFVQSLYLMRTWLKCSSIQRMAGHRNRCSLPVSTQCMGGAPLTHQKPASALLEGSYSASTDAAVTEKLENEVDDATAGTSKIPDVTYTISHDDFKWVRRLFPPSVVPEPPPRSTYPSPTGYQPPSDTIPDVPYFIGRNIFHALPVKVKTQNNGRVLTLVTHVEGDIWALEKELVELIRPHLRYDPATRVHEVARIIFVKGDHVDRITRFLLDKGF